MASTSKGSARNNPALALLVLTLLLVSGSAWAKKRVVILDFVGPQAAKATRAVEDAVSSQYDLVPASDYVQAQKRLKIKKVTDENVARIASEIQVDAVVAGKVAKRGKGWTLQVTVREGKSGETVDTLRIGLAGARFDARAEKEIGAELLPSLDKVVPLVVAVGKDPMAQEEEIGIGAEETAATSTPERESDARDSGTVATSTQERLYRDSRGGISAGVLGFHRELTFDHNLPMNLAPPNYSVPLVAAMVVDGEVYPLAFGGRAGVVSQIGVSFSLSHTLTMNSEKAGKKYPTTQSHWDVGLRYRWNIGDRPTQPTLYLGVGYGQEAFVIDTSGDNIDLPDVTTSYLDLGASARIPLARPHLALSVGGHYLRILSSGDISASDHYGGGSVLGLVVDLGLEYRLLGHYSLRIGGQFQRVAYAFDGSGAETTGRDTDAEQDVNGAVEQYLSGIATVGYLF